MKRETRVGVAAVLSFVVLVTATLIHRGWIGGKQPVKLALNTPGEGKTPGDDEKNPDGKSENTGAKPGDPAPTRSPASESKAPQPTPGGGAAKDAKSKAGGTGGAPAPGGENARATLLGSNSEPNAPVTIPEDHSARPPTVPTGAVDALQIPGDTPSSPPPGASLPGPADLPPSVPPEGGSNPPTSAGPPPMGDLPSITPTPGEKTETPPLGLPAVVAAPSGPPPVTPLPTAEPPPAIPSMVAAPSVPPAATPSPAAEAIPTPSAPPSMAQVPSADPAPAPTLATEPPKSPPALPTAPVRSEQPPTLESVPAAASNSSSASAPASDLVQPTAAVAPLGAGWVVPSNGGRRIVGAVPLVSTSSDSPTAQARVADNPRGSDEPGIADQVEPVLHRVLPNENFWTISKVYYGSGRFYRALHAANARQVPNIAELYVGTVLRIPPPETLNRTLIDPPTRSKSDDAAAPATGRTSKRTEPTDESDLAVPARPRLARPEPEPAKESRRPSYTVKPNETLRGIARDTLDDPKRYKEIFNLNRNILDDPTVLPAGTTLILPEDATLGRRLR